MKNLISEELEEQLDELYSEEEYDEELEYYDEETEDLAQDEADGARFLLVDHHRRAESFYRLSDGNTTSFANIALEYFGNRCALSGERFTMFDEPILEGLGHGTSSNLSAEHVIALAIGGDDIAPNIVPAVYQYNIKKNGYYILDWWTKQNDINGKPLYTPERLLKLTNFMLKSLAARKSGKQSNIEEYRDAILTPNAIDEYLSQLELEDETLDNSERKILSDTITATTIIDDKKLLTKIPEIEGSIPSHKVQVEEREKTYQDTHMMEYFLSDAIKLIKKDKELGSREEITSTLDNMYESIMGTLSYEITVRNYILELLNELGIENNQYTIANDWLTNTEVLQKSQGKSKEEIQQEVRDLIDNFKMKYNISEERISQIISVNPSVICDKDIDRISELWEKYAQEQSNNFAIFETETINLYYVLEIAEWAAQKGWLPRRDSKEADEEEKRLGSKLNSIRSWLKKSKEIKGKEEVRIILEELDIKYQMYYGTGFVQLTNAEKVKKWVEENGKLPSQLSDDKEEHRMYVTILNLTRWINKSGEVKGEVIEQVKAIIKELEDKYNKHGNGFTQLVQIKEIREWAEKNGWLPRRDSKEAGEEEKRFGTKLHSIRSWLKETKEVMWKEEIRTILEELDSKYNERKIKYGNELIQLVQIKEIAKWADQNDRLPIRNEKDKEEYEMARKLSVIREWLKREKEGSEEVRKILEELDNKYNERKIKYGNELTQLVQIKEIAKWVEQNGYLPRKDSEYADNKENELGSNLHNIRGWIKKGKDGSEEVKRILEELDTKYKGKKPKTNKECIQLVQIKKSQNGQNRMNGYQ